MPESDVNIEFTTDNENWTIQIPSQGNITYSPSDYLDLLRAEESIPEQPVNPDVIEDEWGHRWYYEVPFLHPRDSIWYVVFRTLPSSLEFYSPNFEQHYRLIHSVSVHGLPSWTYRIEWIDAPFPYEDEEYYDDEPESEYYPEDYIVPNDGYSVEVESVDTRDYAPSLHTNIGRNIPLVSFEQEFSGDGDKVARMLYDAGISHSRYSDGYHVAEGRHLWGVDDRICYIETDSSCGYEIIFDRLDLTNRNIAEKVSQAQKILKELKDMDSIRLSARCGFHVHVDVKNWGMREIVSAYHLWNYLEDPIFRFASAFWGMHRDEEVGGGYSAPVPKGHSSRVDIANTLYDRRDSLNFSHILRAKSNCGCGAAVYEDWGNCSCNLRQPTLEFRVFNATLNQRKIRAYLAFCVAFVNHAQEIEHDAGTFPEMRWRGTDHMRYSSIRGITEDWGDAALERVRYILDEFPLTNAEKSDIRYCMKNSSLESIVERL